LANALTVPHAIAALVLGVAGLAKLRSPWAAAGAGGVRPAAIRGLATFELALAGWALLAAGALGSALMSALYLGFAATALVLARRGQACGCFGSEREPASVLQALVSVALALICAACALSAPHALGWILGRSPGIASVLVLGTAGAVYGVVLAYSELPLLWRSWSPAAAGRPMRLDGERRLAAGRLMRPPAVASLDGERRPAAGRLMRPPAVASLDGERRPA
jgi:hypothetical protein